MPGGGRRSALQALKQPHVRLDALRQSQAVELEFPVGRLDLATLETSVKYEGYLRRQEVEVARRNRDEDRGIPQSFPYQSVPGLSREVMERLGQVRPATLGQALRVPGVTPAAIAVIAIYLRKFTAPRHTGDLKQQAESHN
jgi:tRNA uridine 5-carboxymethylaminomethyl modification enzyme